MSRYIDADKYLEKARYEAQAMPKNCGFAEYTEWLIDKTPSIEIVRCKECKHGEYRKEYDDYECHASGCGLVYDADFFCADGERREP